MNVGPYENDYAERCAQILSRKLERGERVFCLSFNSNDLYGNSHGLEIKECMKDYYVTIYYELVDTYSRHTSRHILELRKKNSVIYTETLISMMNEDRFIETKQHLVRVLPFL